MSKRTKIASVPSGIVVFIGAIYLAYTGSGEHVIRTAQVGVFVILAFGLPWSRRVLFKPEVGLAVGSSLLALLVIDLGPVYEVAKRRQRRMAARCKASRNDLASLS